ncbi:MAG TPA: hypothetical protein VE152_14335 [Acidimicrobiales bacterium]|nr:hypothetical protein [Acidimicrobiales bacterium]
MTYRIALHSEGQGPSGQVWAACQCGWTGPRHQGTMAGISPARADRFRHVRETGHGTFTTDGTPTKPYTQAVGA